MAYKFQVGSATLSDSLVQEGEIKIQNESAVEHAKLTQAGVVSGSGEAAFGSIKLGGTAVTATAAELNYLDNSDLTAADITKLAALTATAAEINYLDNDDLTAADITKLAALTATAAEINYLDNDDLTAADITKLAALTATAAEINYLDLTNAIGTVGASEAVVTDANKDVSGFRNVTTTGRVIVDDTTEATSTSDGSVQTDGGLSVAKSAVIGDDLDLLSDAAILNFGADKDVNLTHVADTGLLLNSDMQLQFRDSTEYINSDADGYMNIRGATGVDLNIGGTDVFRVASGGVTATSAKISDLTQGRLVTAGTNGELEDQAALYYDDARASNDGYLQLAVSSSASGSSHLQDGSMQIVDENGDPQMWIYKNTAMLPAAGDAALNGGEDSLYFYDATDQTIKRDEWADVRDGLIFGVVSGDASIAAGGALTIAAGAVEHGMLNDNIISGQSALGGASVAQADLLMLDDGPGAVKKVTFSNFEDSIFGNISGDATVAAGGALTIAADAVESGMLNDNVISGQTELGEGSLVAADELMISDGGVLKRIGADTLFINGPALLTETAMVVADDYVMFLDGGATGDAKKEKWADLVALMAGAGLNASNGQLSTQAGSVAAIADGGTLAEGYNYLADLTGNATVTLPASPSVGDVVHIKAAGLANSANVIINRAGSSQVIDNDLTSVRIESAYGAVSLVLVAANEWRLV